MPIMVKLELIVEIFIRIIVHVLFDYFQVFGLSTVTKREVFNGRDHVTRKTETKKTEARKTETRNKEDR